VINETKIPVPKIYAYNLGDGSQPLSSYVILEYIEGEVFSYARLKTLSDKQRKRLYTSLADIYIQLRRLEFPSIGCLAHGPEGFNVRKRIATIDINMQELEGLQPSKIQSSFYNNRGSLTSANEYVAMLLQIADNAFVKGRNSVSERHQGEDALYHLHIFREYTKSWMDCRLDQGPFVLVHGDLEPYNLIVNDNMDIVSLLDWEWSRVVPLQFFKPPLWLKNPDTTKLAWNFVYRDYLKSLTNFWKLCGPESARSMGMSWMGKGKGG
jgi:serine/threonine protein kinase